MKTLFILSACLIIATNDYVSESDIEREWKSFKDTYNKHYADNATEEIRKQIFINNTRMIKEHNAKFETGNVTFNMGMNQFGDMNHEEFLKRFSYREVNETHFRYNYSNNVSIDGPDNKEVRSRRSLPTEFRWEIPEEVIPVRDQGDCRSGWAYSAADTIASRCFLHKDCKKTIGSLSVQYLINCTSNLGNHRCQGGEAANACDLVRLNKKMPDEKSYNRQCSMAKFEHKINLNIVRCCQLIVNDSRSSKNLKKSIRKLGPVSGSVSVEQPSFQFAKEGIYYEEKCEKVANHDVLVVGYGTDNKGHNYWIVKNSFGISWGDNGFLKISARATKDKCRILNRYMFPKFKDQRPDLIIFL
ncbi:digestive cysteine proteinase 3-like [Planococcus citri]|uniref:digestive cysteine proteinase 3-like n=1 Tax=Planococcus citri TaxID=170843 RepID=UPI0031F90F1E